MDIFDCWIYIVKNMNMFEQMPFSEKYPVFRKLAEIGDLRKLSREELELYDEDIKNMRDIYATRKFDEKKGMEKGMEKEKLATARRLLSMGLSDEQVFNSHRTSTGGNPEIKGTSLKLAELSGTQM